VIEKFTARIFTIGITIIRFHENSTIMLNKKSIIVITITLFSVSFAFGQKDIKRIKITEFSLLPSGYIESNPSTTIEDFYSLAPNSKLLPPNFDDFNTNFHSQNISTGGFNTSFLLGFKFSKKDGSAYRPNPILRMGLTYSFAQNVYFNTYKEDVFAYDTLISSNTGDKTPVDSVSTTGYDLSYYSQQLKLDVSVLFRTNPEKRWVLFAGVGITFGGSLNAKTEITKFNTSYISPNSNSQVAYYNQNQEYEIFSEQIISENNMAFSGYIPMGLDFRVSNNNEFWRMIHLFLEMRPSINITSIPELRTVTNPAFQFGFGVKVQW